MKDDEKQTNGEGQNETADKLPDKSTDTRYLNENEEWPNLEKRLGQPRIKDHCFFPGVMEWLRSKDLDALRFLDAGCGHGNDLRAFMNALGGKGNFTGVDLSQAEILRGLEYYSRTEGEDVTKSRYLFATGDLRDLMQVSVWDEDRQEFSLPGFIDDGTFDLIYMEAVLHAFGHGLETYREKKDSAREVFKELFRVCATGGKFLGRANAFKAGIPKERQFEILRKNGEWRFIPEVNEVIALLSEAGFSNIKFICKPHEKAGIKTDRKDVVKLSFLAEKW